MSEIQSTDYHDFVFRDGKLIGEFEQMYQKSSAVPWHQDSDPARLDCRLAAEFISAHGPFAKVIEVGCGLGYFAEMLRARLAPSSITGFDIAPTAIAKARGLFPRVGFEVLDIAQPRTAWAEQPLPADLVVIRGCFWYLFEQMEPVVENLHALTSPGGMIFVAQNFPPLDQDFVGKKTLPNPGALLRYFERRFRISVTNELVDLRSGAKNDHWIMFVGEKVE
jgi:SAM-dependent methyltransferase